MFEHDEIIINSDGKVGKHNVIAGFTYNLVKEIARQIMEEEDREIFKILDSLDNSGNNVI